VKNKPDYVKKNKSDEITGFRFRLEGRLPTFLIGPRLRRKSSPGLLFSAGPVIIDKLCLNLPA
jgi:hypothetical protein